MGRPSKPKEFHILQGSFRPDRHGDQGGWDEEARVPPQPMKKLNKRKQQIWDEKIATVPWLTEHDAMMCMVYVELYAEFEKNPTDMQTSRIQAMTKVANDLGLTAVARSKVPSPEKKKDKSPNDPYFQ